MNDNDELYIEQIQIGPMQNFTYVVGSNVTREVALIDPAWEVDALLEHVQLKGFTVTAALVTHYHPDHCGGGMGGRRIPGITELSQHLYLPSPKTCFFRARNWRRLEPTRPLVVHTRPTPKQR